MAILSKQVPSIPYNCYETFHPWDPDCSESAFSTAFLCFISAMKLYGSLYLTAQAFQRKWSLKAFLRTVENTCTSSIFLAANGYIMLLLICLLRKLFGKYYYPYSIDVPAFVASFIAVSIERKSRRGPLALYVANVATETVFKMLVSRGLIRPIKSGEVYLFCASLAAYLYIIRRKGFNQDISCTVLRYVIGKEEAGPLGKFPSPGFSEVHPHGPKGFFEENCSSSRGTTSPSLYVRGRGCVHNMWNNVKHESCPHSMSCFHYVLQLINCVLRWSFGRDNELYAIPAAFLGGLFMKLFPNSTIALYFFWKMMEVAYTIGIQNGLLPEVKVSTLLLYAISTAILSHAVFLEPHNLKSEYFKFILKVTNKRLQGVNRRLLDAFGTNASKLHPDFWPELDIKHTSKELQENFLVWMIH